MQMKKPAARDTVQAALAQYITGAWQWAGEGGVRSGRLWAERRGRVMEAERRALKWNAVSRGV